MPKRYRVIQTRDGSAWIKADQFQRLKQVDAIAFDCDGVLVDARRSYDATITRVVSQLLDMTLGVKLPWKDSAPRLIAELRRTGGFNNDWDTTYALILFTVLALPRRVIRELVAKPLASENRRFNCSQKRTLTSIASLVRKFCSKSNGNSNASDAVNRFVETNSRSEAYDSVIDALKEQLGYPGSPPNSLLASLFDEIYHGPVLFRRMYDVEARQYRGKGLIENERLLIKRRDLESSDRILGGGRLAIITGRPYLPTEHVLHEILDCFNPNASLYIGDIDRGRSELTAFRKPSGRGLTHARRALSSDMLLYVGDSAEDLEMVENARLEEEPVLSAGVYGTNVDRATHLKFLFERGTDLILPTARKITDLLRFVRDEKRSS